MAYRRGPRARVPRDVREPLQPGVELGRDRPVARLRRLLPHRTTDALPANGIASQISLSNEKPPAWVPRIAWPPRIRARDVVPGFEGLQPRIGVYQRIVRVGPLEAYVWAFFGRDRPTAAQLRAANAELAAARLPS